MMIQAYAVAEHPEVLTPFMVNLDGFVLTHTYELVDLPEQEAVDAFLPAFQTTNKMDLEAPTNMGFTATPAHYTGFKIQQHRALLAAGPVIREVDERFSAHFGRCHGGLVEGYRLEDAELVLVTLGSVTGTARVVVDALRAQGRKVGLVKLRYLRPFPERELVELLRDAKAIGVLEKNISMGFEGTVFTNVNSALLQGGWDPRRQVLNFVAGLGGRDIAKEDIAAMFDHLEQSLHTPPAERVIFINPGVLLDEPSPVH
jgi:pyruvate ferredoxin oxidoreductase alpha subunit